MAYVSIKMTETSSLPTQVPQAPMVSLGAVVSLRLPYRAASAFGCQTQNV